MMAGENRCSMETIEGIIHQAARSFFGVTLAPEGRPKMYAKLDNLRLLPVGAQAGATNVPAVLEQKDRPILDSERFFLFNLLFEPRLHSHQRKRPADESSDCGIAPEFKRNRQVVRSPIAESQSR